MRQIRIQTPKNKQTTNKRNNTNKNANDQAGDDDDAIGATRGADERHARAVRRHHAALPPATPGPRPIPIPIPFSFSFSFVGCVCVFVFEIDILTVLSIDISRIECRRSIDRPSSGRTERRRVAAARHRAAFRPPLARRLKVRASSFRLPGSISIRSRFV
jgi:hypothetical protein